MVYIITTLLHNYSVKAAISNMQPNKHAYVQ